MKYIKSRVTDSDYSRLKRICSDFHFKSPYQILQYLIDCFLRAVDRGHDEDEEPLSEEIEKMFRDYSESEPHYEAKKPKRRCNTTIKD